MKCKVVFAAIFAAVVATLAVTSAGAQCNPTCEGDFNGDQQVTVAELVAAVNRALDSCSSPEQQGCVASGGHVSTALCCPGLPTFPDTCTIGTCGCAPQLSEEVAICVCGVDTCFDRDQRTCVPR